MIFKYQIFYFPEQLQDQSVLICSGRPHYNVSLTAYYPDFTSNDESDYLDIKGKKLRTLQVCYIL
jgi:hypothetical protein